MTNAALSPHARRIRLFAALAMAIGVLFVFAGIGAWIAVSTQLAAENITVSEDAAILAGSPVQDPVSAFAQAEIINQHALEMTDGKTYAELGKDDPLRDTMKTASALRTSLFTSVISFGVALFAIGAGVVTMVFAYIAMLSVRREVVPAN